MSNPPNISVLLGDITLLEVDAIVNAANSSLLVGGGVDGSIHRAAGSELEREVQRLYGRCETGDAVISSGFNLPAKYVIHAVGPRYMDGLRNEPELLRSCYLRSLELAHENSIQSLAFPSISTGVYGYPKQEAASIAISALEEYFSNTPNSRIKQVFLVAFNPNDHVLLSEVLDASPLQSQVSTRSRYLGAMMGLAVGDTLGASVEFLPRDSYSLTDMPTTEIRGVMPGYFTDDTSMALCLAESLIVRKEFDPQDQMERYVRWYDEGYLSPYNMPFGLGNTVHDAILRYKRDGEPFAGLDHPGTAGNGSLMRLAPIPMFYRKDKVKAEFYAGESSRITHQATEAIDACKLYSKMMVSALNGGSKEEILDETGELDSLSDKVRQIALGSYKTLKRDATLSSGYVIHSLEAALWAFYHTTNFTEGALLAVNLGDDTDTVAAIYGMLAGAYYGVNEIPQAWRDQIVMRNVIEKMATELYLISEVMG